MMKLLWPLCKGLFVPCRIGTQRLRQDLSLTATSSRPSGAPAPACSCREAWLLELAGLAHGLHCLAAAAKPADSPLQAHAEDRLS